MKKKEPKIEMDAAIEEAVQAVDKREKKSEGGDSKDGDLYERLIRVTADYENFRKRTQKEKSDLVLYGNENLLREVLPILDNFERALEHVQKSEEVESIRTGVELIFSQLKTTLERAGLKTQASLGETFDPLIHEAVNHLPSQEFPANVVMEEHQKAYFLHQRLLRPSMVTVSKGNEAPNPKKDADLAGEEVSDEKNE